MLVFGMMMITHCCHAVNNHFKILEMDKCVVSMFKTVRHSHSHCLSALWLLWDGEMKELRELGRGRRMMPEPKCIEEQKMGQVGKDDDEAVK